MADSWVARKLAERAGQPPPAPTARPSYAPQGGYPGYVAPASVPGHQQPTVPQAYQQPQVQPNAQAGIPVLQPMDPNDPSLPQMSAYQRAALGAGDPMRTTECPECHQNSLYQITKGENGGPLRMLPKPYCTECGWPNSQSGSIHGGLSIVKPVGRAKPARQLAGHPVEIYNEQGRVVDVYEPQKGGLGGQYV